MPKHFGEFFGRFRNRCCDVPLRFELAHPGMQKPAMHRSSVEHDGKGEEHGRDRRPLLYSAEENGIVMALYAATGALDEANEANSRSRIPPKVQGGYLGSSIAVLEFLLCYCEGTVVYALFFTVLSTQTAQRFPRSGTCGEEEGAVAAATCMLSRDWQAMLAMVLAAMGMLGFLCWQYS